MDELGSRLRLPIFFFGTLMDRDVLGQVLARPVALDEIEPAMLRGFRRHSVVGVPYPVLRPDLSAAVHGVLFAPQSDIERTRVDHFEDAEYHASVVRVQVADRVREAFAYRDLEGVFELAGEEWSLARFEREHKAGYLDACRQWMADFSVF